MKFSKESMGSNIKKARKKKGYTQAQLAEIVELSNRTVQLMENGKSGMKIETLIKFCDALDVSPNYILSYKTDENSLEDVIKNFSEEEINTIKNFFEKIS